MTTELSPIEAIDNSITERRSIRAFLPTSVEKTVIEDILKVAARAPSGTNMQPWHVQVLQGNAKKELSDKILEQHFNPENKHKSEYDYYPGEFFEPYRSRRKKVGLDLYSLLGIEKGAVEKMMRQHGRNYSFFDAPIGMIFSIDNRLKIGSWLDYGMFLQNIMIAAKARGLDTCPQAAFAQYHEIIRDHLDIEEHHTIICGMSLGYADKDAIENTLVSEREPLSEFVRFYGD